MIWQVELIDKEANMLLAMKIDAIDENEAEKKAYLNLIDNRKNIANFKTLHIYKV